MRIAELAEAKPSAATCFCLCGGDGLGSCTTGFAALSSFRVCTRQKQVCGRGDPAVTSAPALGVGLLAIFGHDGCC